MKPDTVTCQAPRENILMHNLWHERISSEILMQTGASGQERAQKETELFNNSTVIPLST